MSKSDLSLYAYQIWVSEIMCQQTRLETAIPFYERWMARFPTLKMLSQASVEDVREMWTGLGYYNRATRLLQGAQKVVEDFNEQMPQDPKVLEKEISGIGPYTSAAITSIAFGVPVAAVDGNVQRVYSRVFGIHANPAAKATSNHLQDLADSMMPKDRPGDFNQALMDLGFSVCTPKKPDCAGCPLQSQCVAYAQERLGKSKPKPVLQDIEATGSGTCKLCSPLPSATGEVTRYPMPKIKKPSKEDDCAVCLLEWRSTASSDRRFLMLKRPEEGLLAGMWEPPSCDMDSGSSAEDRLLQLQRVIKRALTAPASLEEHKQLPSIVHKFSHITRTYLPIHTVLTSEDLPTLRLSSDQAKWQDADTFGKSNIPTAIKTIWTAFLAGPTSTSQARNKKRKIKESEPDQSQSSLSKFFSKRESREVDLEPASAVGNRSAASPAKARKVRVIADSDSD